MFMRRPRRSVLRRLRIGHDFAARPELDAQAWALGYLRAVALAAGLLGPAGVALHAMSQQRRRTVASLLLSRIGLSRRSADGAAEHRRSGPARRSLTVRRRGSAATPPTGTDRATS
jgi:hypothetical protein